MAKILYLHLKYSLICQFTKYTLFIFLLFHFYSEPNNSIHVSRFKRIFKNLNGLFLSFIFFFHFADTLKLLPCGRICDVHFNIRGLIGEGFQRYCSELRCTRSHYYRLCQLPVCLFLLHGNAASICKINTSFSGSVLYFCVFNHYKNRERERGGGIKEERKGECSVHHFAALPKRSLGVGRDGRQPHDKYNCSLFSSCYLKGQRP